MNIVRIILLIIVVGLSSATTHAGEYKYRGVYVYDDGKNTIYLKVDRPMSSHEDRAVSEIILKKQKWAEDNPAKKIITMTIVTGDGDHGHSFIAGLLIHYE